MEDSPEHGNEELIQNPENNTDWKGYLKTYALVKATELSLAISKAQVKAGNEKGQQLAGEYFETLLNAANASIIANRTYERAKLVTLAPYEDNKLEAEEVAKSQEDEDQPQEGGEHQEGEQHEEQQHEERFQEGEQDEEQQK